MHLYIGSSKVLVHNVIILDIGKFTILRSIKESIPYFRNIVTECKSTINKSNIDDKVYILLLLHIRIIRAIHYYFLINNLII